MTWPVRRGVLELGDLALEHGGTLPNARLVWQTHGALSPARDNAVLYPCSYGARTGDLSWLIGPDGVLDPTRWCVVVPGMFSGGESTSASQRDGFPLVTVGDNVASQARLLAQLGVERLHAVYGFSMGGLQAYHWAAHHPDQVERAVVVCGAARTAPHNRVFLSGLLRLLEAAPEHLGDGRFSAEPRAALRAFSHVYAGWALSQGFYRQELYRTVLGYPDLETFLREDWEAGYGSKRAADLYAQALTWSHADISAGPRYGGDLAAALRAVTARVLLLPGATDLYFRVADNAAEIDHLASAELRPIPSLWGHRAGNPRTNSEDLAFLRDAVRDWLDT